MFKELPFINSRMGQIFLFWVLVPVLLPMFALMYSIFMSFAALPLFALLGTPEGDLALWVARAMQGVSFLMGLATTIWLWRQYKRHFVESASHQ